jgi:hypothetical protein
MNYYDIIAASHSECKRIQRGHQYQPPEEVFALGKMVHALLEGVPVPDATEQAIKMATAVATVLQPMLVGKRYKLEHEYYRRLSPLEYTGLPSHPVYEKAKLDLVVPRELAVDYKTTAVSTEQQFLAKCRELGYYEQAVRYMHMARVPRYVIIGVSKVNFKTWVLVISIEKKPSDLYDRYTPIYKASNQRWIDHNFSQIDW